MEQLIVNKRESALIGLKINFMLIAVALVLSICYTIGLTIVSGVENFSYPFIDFFISYLLLILSITMGIVGLFEIRSEGFKNNWDPEIGYDFFKMQVLFLIISPIFYSFGILLS